MIDSLHPEAVFYVELLSDPCVRARLNTVASCNEILEAMEDDIPHEHQPSWYDWLVRHRNNLFTREFIAELRDADTRGRTSGCRLCQRSIVDRTQNQWSALVPRLQGAGLCSRQA